MEGENEGEGVSRATACFLLGSEYTHAGRVHKRITKGDRKKGMKETRQ